MPNTSDNLPFNDIILLRFATLKKGNDLETERLLYSA